MGGVKDNTHVADLWRWRDTVLWCRLARGMTWGWLDGWIKEIHELVELSHV